CRRAGRGPGRPWRAVSRYSAGLANAGYRSLPMYRTLLALAFLWLSLPARADAPPSVHTEVLIKSTASWDGAPLPTYPAGAPEVTVLRIRIPPGVQLPVHRHPVINAGVLLRGELTVTSTSGQTLRLKAGDALVELVDTWHTGRN